MPFPGSDEDEQTKLRRFKAGTVVVMATKGAALRCRARKDEAERVLTVEVWWWARVKPEEVPGLIVEAERALRLWVWEGWTVRVLSAGWG